jgi:hypothetical protein
MKDSGTFEPSNRDVSETHRPRRMLRSIGAVLAGLLAIIILSSATDIALHATGVFLTSDRVSHRVPGRGELPCGTARA